MLNQIVIMGRLGKDPEIRRTQSGKAVASFSLAVDREKKSADGDRVTDWIECVAWEKKAEFAEKYVHKGDNVAVKGRLQIRSWKDKEGNNRKTAEVLVESIYFGAGKKESASEKPSYNPVNVEFTEMTGDDDLPF